MIETLVPLLMFGGLVWAFFMVRATFGVLGLAPKGQRLRTYNRLGMWNFGAIRTELGPAVDPHLSVMRRGAYIFLAMFILVLAVAVAAIALHRPASAHALPSLDQAPTRLEN